MRTLLITGKTGSGKSKFLGNSENPYIIDPLAGVNPTARLKTQWHEPDASTTIGIIAFDHISYLPDAAMQVEAARTWCAKHNKPIWLIDNRREDFDNLDIMLDNKVVELRLSLLPDGSSQWAIVDNRITRPLESGDLVEFLAIFNLFPMEINHIKDASEFAI